VYGYSNASSGTTYGVQGYSSSNGGTGVYGVASATSGTTWGIYGTSYSTSGVGAVGNANATSGTTYGVQGFSASTSGTGVSGSATAASGNTSGVYGASASTSGLGVYGTATATSGTGSGVYGASASGGGFGVVGYNPSTSGFAVGVEGLSYSSTGVAIFGQAVAPAETNPSQTPRGIVGTTNVSSGVGVLGTNDNGIAMEGANNAGNIATADFVNNESTNFMGPVIVAHGSSYDGICLMDVSGDLACNGSKSAVVPVDGGTRKVALYAVEAPENWFEDFGSGHLASGSAVVQLEPIFAQTVNTGEEYHVFLTPNGDCKGLYVTNKTGASFEVRELGGGTASIAFDYRIIARRKGYESIRLADNTERFAAIANGERGPAGTRALVAPTVPEAKTPTARPMEFVPAERPLPLPQRPVAPARQETPSPQVRN